MVIIDRLLPVARRRATVLVEFARPGPVCVGGTGPRLRWPH
jgi:hypothetical protein